MMFLRTITLTSFLDLAKLTWQILAQCLRRLSLLILLILLRHEVHSSAADLSKGAQQSRELVRLQRVRRAELRENGLNHRQRELLRNDNRPVVLARTLGLVVVVVEGRARPLPWRLVLLRACSLFEV